MGDAMLLMPMALPLLAGLLVPWLGRTPNLREGVAILLGVATAASLLPYWSGAHPAPVELYAFNETLSIRFELEPLGLLFAQISATLWPLTTLYALGYMRGNAEVNQTRFFTCFAISIFAAQWIALSANLLTLFIGYEVLSLATWPLVAHKGDDKARAGGRTYLGYLLGSSIGLLLPAIIYIHYLVGSLDFVEGGLLSGAGVDPLVLTVLYTVMVFGVGKAALMPLHPWLPAAMVAPTPVSALLHAVAVVKAGVFIVLKLSVYTFGLDTLNTTGASQPVLYIAAFSLVAASCVALFKDNLKQRLAYSTVSQLAYVTLAAAIAVPLTALGGAVHILMHACGKITLFFCAGAIYTAVQRTLVSELDGLGRAMPFTFGAFAIAAISIIGLPPLGGAWSKWWLTLGALDAGMSWVILVLVASTVLNIAYLLPIPIRGFVGRSNVGGLHEAPWTCVLPLVIAAAGCIVLFFAGEHITTVLARQFGVLP